jgi:mannose/fructose/N-acetylgalactosamine-specific phosphotransferase system component IIC
VLLAFNMEGYKMEAINKIIQVVIAVIPLIVCIINMIYHNKEDPQTKNKYKKNPQRPTKHNGFKLIIKLIIHFSK